MIPYNQSPRHELKIGQSLISSFLNDYEANIDWKTVQSFGDEWNKFNSFSEHEIDLIGNDYFDIVDQELLKGASVLDMGCGSGRWSKFLCNKVKWIEAIDPSDSIIAAEKLLQNSENVRITQASVENIPFPKKSFDLVISLGVLHHIPDTIRALEKCVQMLKNGGHCLIYLYYDLDNRGFFFRILFGLVSLLRQVISKLPRILKKITCDIIAITIYFPLSRISKLFKLSPKLFYMIPLSYYHDKPLNILRNDALDRFGTPLEQRFSKDEISTMMENCGLSNIIFSDRAPYWHAIGCKNEQ